MLPIALPGLLPLAVVAGIWAVALRRRPGAPAYVRWIPLALAGAVGASLLGTIWGVVTAFGAMSADPAEKATRLSEGIAWALRATVFGWGTLLVVVALLVAATWRARTRSAEPLAE